MPDVQTVDPYPPNQNPQWCGTVDVPTPVGHDDSIIDDTTLDVLVFFAKMIAAGPLGFLGATAALVGCIVEATEWFKPFGVAEDPSSPPTLTSHRLAREQARR